MATPKAQAPIIIKKKGGHGGHHGGAWKVAYADFVTAMMALFIVLWLLKQQRQSAEGRRRLFSRSERHGQSHRQLHGRHGRSLCLG